MKTDQKGNLGILTVLAVVLLVVLSGTSVYFWQKYEQTRNQPGATEELSYKEALEMDMVDEETPATSEADEETVVVVYTPGGLFSEAEKSEIDAKFVNPFIDWSNDIEQYPVSVEIEKPAAPVAGYRYEFTYINQGGGNGGFLFGTQTPLEWWIPTCMGGCNLSAEFIAKYPEIAAQVD